MGGFALATTAAGNIKCHQDNLNKGFKKSSFWSLNLFLKVQR